MKDPRKRPPRYTDAHARSGVREPLPPLETWPSAYADDYEIVIAIPEFTSIRTALSALKPAFSSRA